MRKFVLVIILLVLFTTGCTKINRLDNEILIEKALKDNGTKTNMAFKGYKMFVPSNMNILSDKDDNIILSNLGQKYYLYVDLTSYYNKLLNNYKINEEQVASYAKILKYDDKEGYILVTKYKSKYFVEVMYNYAKIEVIAENYKSAICNSLIILKNITYNDKIIESLIGKNALEYNEEKFNLLGPTNETTDFLEWNYQDVDNELKDLDEDIIDIEKTE